jgi:hypothetical protein
MLKINANLNKGKTQLAGRFKLPYSRSQPLHDLPKLVDEQRTGEVEHLVGSLFIKYLREEEKKKVLYFSPNKEDDHKNPDLLFHIEGKLVGVQVTQFVLREFLSRFNQAKGICEKLSGFISDIYKPPITINVSICTPWDSDEVPKGRIKIYQKLAEIIAKSISENIDLLIMKGSYLNFNIHQPNLKDIAESYSLLAVPNYFETSLFGGNNVYIDYGFDNVLIFKEDIEETAKKIYHDKNNGNSQILHIWGDSRQFMNTENHIIEALKEQFKKTTFELVYFMAFANLLEVHDRVIYVNRVK